jgi:hypothetical protein
MDCTIANFLETTYEKYPDFEAMLLMEYEPFTSYLVQNLPSQLSSNKDFKSWLAYADPQNYYSPKIFGYSDLMVMTMPEPRYAAYQYSNFDEI